MDTDQLFRRSRVPWNKGKLVGQKAPFKPKDIWAMRVQFQREQRKRELALLNLAVDSKLRACDLVALKVRDIVHGERVASRAIVLQSKTNRPVQFEITKPAREALEAWIREAHLKGDELPVPEPAALVAAYLHSSVRAHAAWLGEGTSGWTGPSTARTRCAARRRR